MCLVQDPKVHIPPENANKTESNNIKLTWPKRNATRNCPNYMVRDGSVIVCVGSAIVGIEYPRLFGYQHVGAGNT